MKPQTSIRIFPFKLLYCFFLLIYGSVFNAQVNLVPNPSFEVYKACPSTGVNDLDSVPPWKGTNGSSDYFNVCGLSLMKIPYVLGDFQYARTGNAFAGQYFLNGYGNNYREYIQVPLINSLIGGKCYLVKFYVNLPGVYSKFACNNIAAYLSVNSFTNMASPLTPNVVSVTPQVISYNNPIISDTLNWVEIGGTFLANGGEKFLSIGNYKSDQNTDTIIKHGNNAIAYYFIDDVSVEQISSPAWLRDTTINAGDSVFIGSNYGGLTCTWYNLTAQLISTKPGFFVKPSANTKYVVHQSFCGGNFIDTLEVKVNHNLVGLKNYSALLSKLLLYPQPAAAELSVSRLDGAFLKANIYDGFGKQVKEITINPKEQEFKINVEDFQNGIYLIKLETKASETFTKRFVINH